MLTSEPTNLQKDNLALLELITQQRFGVEYQPLIDTLTGSVMGYEALARFYCSDDRPLSPLTVFKLLHDSPLMLAQVELHLKRLQVRYRPDDLPLFLNLDPHAFAIFSEVTQGGSNEFISLLRGHSGLVIEIIENTDVNDATISQQMSELMREQGFSIALDDLGAPGSMVSLTILSEVDFIKFDRSWLKETQNDSMQLLLRSVINFARLSGKKTVIEGVETAEDLAKAVNLGIDYVQGFFYQELFVTQRCYG